jgi:uncharacterized protein YhhL (DUF1145 family)
MNAIHPFPSTITRRLMSLLVTLTILHGAAVIPE